MSRRTNGTVAGGSLKAYSVIVYREKSVKGGVRYTQGEKIKVGS
jgi:hypothetical protein